MLAISSVVKTTLAKDASVRYNSAAMDTYAFDPMLSKFRVTIATLINFTQNSDLTKSD